jgi:hypothetical protein
MDDIQRRPHDASINDQRSSFHEDPASPSLGDLNLDLIGQMFAARMGTATIPNSIIEVPESEAWVSVPNVKRLLYDPRRPNDYEKVLREREARAEEDKRAALEEDFRLRQQIYGGPRPEAPPEMVRLMDDAGPLIDRKIVRMLEKYGWEHGKGMGAEEKGMLNPLIAVKKTGQTATILEVEDPAFQAMIGNPQSHELAPPAPQQTTTVPQKAVIYQSGPIVEDPRIKPIQEKYFRA